MRHRRSALIQLGILVLLGASVVLSLVLPQLSVSGREHQPMEVSVIIREADSSPWSNVRLGLEQAAGDYGAELRFLTLSRTNDGSEQADLVRREAEGGADALVVVAADPENLATQLPQGVGNCPVVCMESMVEGCKLTVAPDNQRLGEELARAVLEDWTGGVVLLLDTGGNSTGVSDRLTAAKQILQQAGVPVETRIARVSALVNVLSALVAETSAVRIMTFEASATEQVILAKENAALLQPLYGVGVSSGVASALERGDVAAIAAWSDYAAGYLAVEGAVHLAQGEEYSADALPVSIVRGEDIYEPDHEKLLFPVTS
ncbi:MAG: sugar ABC transporter substrate-binding protein [Lawsonibacter sp.]|jgi:ABC-type sugar transport system substrate-binding protein